MAEDRNSQFDLEPDTIPRWEDDGAAVHSEDSDPPPPPPPGATPSALCPRARRRTARTAHALLLAKGGATIDPLTGNSVGSVNMWCVGLGERGLVLKHPPRPSDIEAYLLDHSDILGTVIPVGAESFSLVYLGVWFNENEEDPQWSIDCTVLIAEFEAAKVLARANKQQSIHNPAASTTVSIDYDKVPATVKKAA